MKLFDRAINSVLKFLATGRVAQKGKLFRINPLCDIGRFPNHLDTFSLWADPDSQRPPIWRCLIEKGDRASFLVLKVQEDVPLWDQWVKVLFCRLNRQNFDDTMIGWLPYHEFNRLVLAQWEKWEDDETRSNT